MIVDLVNDDITSTKHKCDIIIGMNTGLKNVTGIGRRAVENMEVLRELKLGSVVTFPWDVTGRELHMIICHKMCDGGWDGADRYVRYGLDYLAHRDAISERGHGIVRIGTGAAGKKFGADPTSILTAMATSYLPVLLFSLDTPRITEPVSAEVLPLRAASVWQFDTGVQKLAA